MLWVTLKGWRGTFSRGNVSAIRGAKGVIQITAPISHGSSGGPVLDERGEVIGVAAGILSEGQNLNFAIPVSKLAELLKPENDLRAGTVSDSATEDDLRAGTVSSPSAPPPASKEPVSEWQYVASGKADCYISRKRMTLTPERTFIAWIKMFPTDSPEGRASRKGVIDELNKRKVNRSDAFSYSMQQQEFDCGHQKIHSLREVDYDQEGIILYDLDLSTTRWGPVLPDSYGEAFLTFVCKGKQ
jgi:hypothetical protein